MWLIIALVAGALGAGAGFFGAMSRSGKQKTDIDKKVREAKEQAGKLLEEARREARKTAEKAEAEAEKTRRESKEQTERLLKREKKLDEKQEELEQKLEKLKRSEGEVEKAKEVVYEIRQQQEEKLVKISKLTKKEAAEKLHQMVERDIRADLQGLIAKLQAEAKAQAEDNARAVLLASMERIASETTAERTITSVKLENEDVKGRIIGKEGRNIQSLQKATGVDILVDDAPGGDRFELLRSRPPRGRPPDARDVDQGRPDPPGEDRRAFGQGPEAGPERDNPGGRGRRPRGRRHRHPAGHSPALGRAAL